jgi:apolipoprotein D and lipocalin family protein
MWSYVALMTATLAHPVAQDTSRVLLQPVAELDLDRYSGRWHEVARLPNRFQDRCTGETTAEYSLLDNGEVRVVNSCRKADGSMMRAEGRARRADRDGPASRLKVRFAPKILSFLPMVWGDYWILDLTDDYDAALVGEPNRQYLWILARTPTLDEATRDRLVRTATAQGFDVSRLIWSEPAATPQ